MARPRKALQAVQSGRKPKLDSRVPVITFCLYFTVGVCCASGAPGRMRPAALCATAPTLVVLVSG